MKFYQKITPDFISDKLLLSYQGDTLIKHYDGKLKSIVVLSGSSVPFKA